MKGKLTKEELEFIGYYVGMFLIGIAIIVVTCIFVFAEWALS